MKGMMAKKKKDAQWDIVSRATHRVEITCDGIVNITFEQEKGSDKVKVINRSNYSYDLERSSKRVPSRMLLDAIVRLRRECP